MWGIYIIYNCYIILLTHIFYFPINYITSHINELSFISPSNTASFSHVSGCGNQCDNDKKPLERHAKDPEPSLSSDRIY